MPQRLTHVSGAEVVMSTYQDPEEQLERSARLVRRGVLPLAGVLVAAVVYALMQCGPRLWTLKPRIVWIEVPAGEFLMGSDPQADPDADSDEMPQQRVYLNAFYISKTEITNHQYKQCVRAKVCEEPRGLAHYQDLNYAHHPVVYVSWFGARAFCEWVGGRLPTEAEWEYAARGPDGHIYPWGNDSPTCARSNFWECSGDTASVWERTDGASWCGVYAMAGNVWEWVNDWYGEYSSTAQKNPTGPERGVGRVLRGGAWLYFAGSVRSANRNWGTPVSSDLSLGFRCAAAVTP